MKITTIISIAFTMVIGMGLVSCQKGDLTANPNAAPITAITPSLIINHLTANLIRNEEMPFGDVNKSNQFQISNYSKYWGNNEYSWSYSAHSYDILSYAVQLEKQASKQLGNTTNKYFALAKFFRAYSAIWLTQRVGDIPMLQAGNIDNLTPAFDSQHDVYKRSLMLLDSANMMFNNLFAAANPLKPGDVFDGGDIFGFTNLKWQKLINSYKLRILISLSKRADDNADLNIKTQFATIIADAVKYPIMASNSDNMVYKYNAVNLYPIFQSGSSSYNNFMNVGKTVLDITTANKDPRTFIYATPASAQIAAGKTISDFTAYVGSDPKTALSDLQKSSDGGNLSFFNASRYLGSNTGATAEPFIFIGYPELCFNIAEGINRGWAATTDAKSYYDKGIASSFTNFGLNVNQNSSIVISNLLGASWYSDIVKSTVTTDNATFLTNVTYNVASSSAALTQILQQKYVAFFMNSGWEAFYNYRRTGVPVFSQGGPGTGTANSLIPRRWLYPIDEINYNNANYKTALTAQFDAGADNVTKDTWLTK